MTDEERRRRARKLRGLRLSRIDLVGAGSNPLSNISFFKHDTTGEVAELKRRIAKAERQTEKLKRVGEPEPVDWYGELEKLARERVAKTAAGKLTLAQARVAIFHQRPDLQAARDAEGRRKYERPDLRRPDKVAAFLAKKRRELGVSQETVAKSAGITQPALSKIESGDTETPTFTTFSRLYSALGLTIEEIQKAGILR